MNHEVTRAWRVLVLRRAMFLRHDDSILQRWHIYTMNARKTAFTSIPFASPLVHQKAKFLIEINSGFYLIRIVSKVEKYVFILFANIVLC